MFYIIWTDISFRRALSKLNACIIHYNEVLSQFIMENLQIFLLQFREVKCLEEILLARHSHMRDRIVSLSLTFTVEKIVGIPFHEYKVEKKKIKECN